MAGLDAWRFDAARPLLEARLAQETAASLRKLIELAFGAAIEVLTQPAVPSFGPSAPGEQVRAGPGWRRCQPAQ